MRTLRYKDTCEILVSEGLLVPADIKAAQEQSDETGEHVIESLLRGTPLTETDLARCLSSQHQLPMIPLNRYERDESLIESFDDEFLLEHGMLPLSRIGAAVLIAVRDVPDTEALKVVREKLHAEPFLTIASYEELQVEISKSLQLDEEKKIELDRAVRTRRRGGRPPETGQQTEGMSSTSSLLESLNDSWENIFEEAEKNIRDGQS